MYTTLNNSVARQIVGMAINNKSVCYRAICGHSDSFTDDMLSKLFRICNELLPFTYDIFRALPFDVQNWYNLNYKKLYAKV